MRDSLLHCLTVWIILVQWASHAPILHYIIRECLLQYTELTALSYINNENIPREIINYITMYFIFTFMELGLFKGIWDHWNTAVLESDRPGLWPWFYQLFNIYLWASYSVSSCLSFLNYQTWIIILIDKG